MVASLSNAKVIGPSDDTNECVPTVPAGSPQDGGQLVQRERAVADRERAVAESEHTEEALRLREKEILRSNSLLRAQQEAAPDGILIVDENHRIAGYNRRLCEMFHTPEEILRAGDDHPHLAYVLSVVAQPDEFLAKVLYLYEHPAETSYDVMCLKDGRTFDRYSGPVIGESGQDYGRIWYFRDSTERRALEEGLREIDARFRGVVEGLQEGILITDFEDITLYTNPRLAELTGWPGSEMQGRPAYQFLLAPEQWPELHQNNERRRGGTAECWETRLQRKDGTQFWAEIKAGPFRDAAGVIVGTLGAITDISTRKALQAEQARLMAEQAQRLAEALEQADRDPLTGLLNHRAFQKRLADETTRLAEETKRLAEETKRLAEETQTQADDPVRAMCDSVSLAVVMLDLDGFKFFNDLYGHLIGDEVLRQTANRLRAACRSGDTIARFGGDEFALLLPGTGPVTPAEIEARLQAALDDICFSVAGQASAVPITVSAGAALVSADTLDWHEALRQADERLYRSKTGGIADSEADTVRASVQGRISGFSMLDALVTAVDNKDRYTRQHSEDVMEYSLQIARGLGLSTAQQHTVAISALLHDVGKIGVPDAILRKPGPLAEAEFEAMKQHPQMGAVIVGAVTGLEDTLDAVRHHHERWDGGGYPFGLTGEETPLIARLMAVADAFSAMTTDRPYRKGMPETKASAILRDGAGSQWDPACVQAFLGTRSQGKNSLLFNCSSGDTCDKLPLEEQKAED